MDVIWVAFLLPVLCWVSALGFSRLQHVPIDSSNISAVVSMTAMGGHISTYSLIFLSKKGTLSGEKTFNSRNAQQVLEWNLIIQFSWLPSLLNFRRTYPNQLRAFASDFGQKHLSGDKCGKSMQQWKEFISLRSSRTNLRRQVNALRADWHFFGSHFTKRGEPQPFTNGECQNFFFSYYSSVISEFHKNQHQIQITYRRENTSKGVDINLFIALSLLNYTSKGPRLIDCPPTSCSKQQIATSDPHQPSRKKEIQCSIRNPAFTLSSA